MQEEYRIKLEQEIQRYNSEQSQRERTDSMARKAEDKLISQQKALETVKRMLHQNQGKTESPEMDWDHYGTQNQITGQPQHVGGAQIPERVWVRWEREENCRKELPLHLWRRSLIPEATVLLDSQQWGDSIHVRIVKRSMNLPLAFVQTVRAHI